MQITVLGAGQGVLLAILGSLALRLTLVEGALLMGIATILIFAFPIVSRRFAEGSKAAVGVKVRASAWPPGSGTTAKASSRLYPTRARSSAKDSR